MPRSKRAEQDPAPNRADVAARVFALMEQGESLRKAAAANNISAQSVLRWCDEDPSLAEQYARARDTRADVLAERVLEIADEPTGTKEFEQHRRARIDSYRWAAGKMAPKRWGDRVDMDITSGGQPLDEVLRRGRERVAKLRDGDASD